MASSGCLCNREELQKGKTIYIHIHHILFYHLLSSSLLAGMVNGVFSANDTFYLEVYRIYLPLVNRQMTSFASFRTDPCIRKRQSDVRQGGE